uniref:ANF_receptor domain-containing protein n=1 Tax=Steinernema glaseri TaxID=37863 RepID=A0A1I7YTB6_9BILA
MKTLSFSLHNSISHLRELGFALSYGEACHPVGFIVHACKVLDFVRKNKNPRLRVGLLSCAELEVACSHLDPFFFFSVTTCQGGLGKAHEVDETAVRLSLSPSGAVYQFMSTWPHNSHPFFYPLDSVTLTNSNFIVFIFSVRLRCLTALEEGPQGEYKKTSFSLAEAILSQEGNLPSHDYWFGQAGSKSLIGSAVTLIPTLSNSVLRTYKPPKRIFINDQPLWKKPDLKLSL